MWSRRSNSGATSTNSIWSFPRRLRPPRRSNLPQAKLVSPGLDQLPKWAPTQPRGARAHTQQTSYSVLLSAPCRWDRVSTNFEPGEWPSFSADVHLTWADFSTFGAWLGQAGALFRQVWPGFDQARANFDSRCWATAGVPPHDRDSLEGVPRRGCFGRPQEAQCRNCEFFT